jgi:hypothetical protein
MFDPAANKGKQPAVGCMSEPDPRCTLSRDTRKQSNRAHGAVDKLPEELKRQIRDWFLGRPDKDIPRLTLDEMSSELAKLGYYISRHQVWRWIARHRVQLERLEEMTAGIESSALPLLPGDSTPEAAMATLFQSLVMRALSTADVIRVTSTEDLERLAHVAEHLLTSQAARDKSEHENEKKITAALQRLKGNLTESASQDPELCARLLALVDEAAEAMMEKGA